MYLNKRSLQENKIKIYKNSKRTENKKIRECIKTDTLHLKANEFSKWQSAIFIILKMHKKVTNNEKNTDYN